MKEYKKYVPPKIVQLEQPIPGVDATEGKLYVPTLVGGDYLSVARAREAQYIRCSSDLKQGSLIWAHTCH